MTQEKADQILAKYGPVVARCRSSSEPGKVYEVRRHPDAKTYSCNCKRWVFNKSCKHTQAAEKTEGRSGVVGLQADGGVIVQELPSIKGMLQLSDAQLTDAIQAAAAKMAADLMGEAKRRVPIRIPPLTVPSNRRYVFNAKDVRKPKPDPITLAARECSARILMWGRDGITPESATLEIEKAIRKFAGSLPAAAPAAASAQRGVREIVLED